MALEHVDRFNKGASLSLILSTVFFDFCGYAMIIPLIPLLILQTPYSLLPETIDEHHRFLILGALLSTYPLSQFLGAPLVGALSDKLNRKKILLLAFAGNILGYTLCLLGIITGNFFGLFAGHFVAGITGANIPTTNAIISDLTSHKNRTRRFSLTTMTLGSAFFISPHLSSRLLSAFTNPMNGCLSIFAIAATVSFINFLLIFFFFHWDSKPAVLQKANFKSLLGDLAEVMRQKSALRTLFLSVFCLFFGWQFFIKFFQVFLVQQFKLEQAKFCNFLSYFGGCCLATQILFYLFFSNRFRERKILSLFSLILSLSILSFIFLKTYIGLIIAITLFSLSYSLITPSLTFIVSEYGSENSNGKIMGIYQSVQSLAKVLAPCLAGITMSLLPKGPIFVSCTLIALTSVLFSLMHHRSREPAKADNI